VVVNAATPSARRSTRTTQASDASGGTPPAGKQSLITGFLKPMDPGASFMIMSALVDTEKKSKKEEKKSDEESKPRKRKAKSVSINA
jgi:hypothetical protein